ncbi:hypothetical protein HanRHA438_Chr14g0653011 [Helianthus annuus]|uniref:Uncharacterized protein n=2 Tax=Helianthus annuus TaxID=4232 RepID=A0A9K3E9T1_HELAN|nr:hypothetical protein HanXRQr2_Chr14g0642191 [Helianthus annuus]KAJ0468462.1 hypothetical protein HanIR_Chr14g0696871 [Helianthus annuus]KAJ0485612.1 hypothetical protein HanHA89_Chr14g0570261 [Helianthus annuus]KAJ0656163.1 hypothetical protein HanLR1_Chr14g0532641 [Helianthus annuus]KAJ0659832.1 hypothetical protein HanOQP8_Chr14g0530671 [Helianthus annuus]
MSPHTTPSSLFILTRRTHRYPVQSEREREIGEQERGRSPISRQQKQQVAAAMDSDNRFSGKTYRRSRRPTYRQVHREDTRRRWWPPPELPSSSNLVLVLRFRFQILFGTASGVTDQIQERSTVNPVKISSFGCRFSGLFGSRFE